MPAMHYTVRWPDAREIDCYSPSLVIQEALSPGADYSVIDFMQRVRRATAIANERVQAKYGFVCSRANDQLAQLEQLQARFIDDPEARVHVLAFAPA
jgi:uncharacterized repeat protein (TIGR04042 family)